MDRGYARAVTFCIFFQSLGVFIEARLKYRYPKIQYDTNLTIIKHPHSPPLTYDFTQSFIQLTFPHAHAPHVYLLNEAPPLPSLPS